MNIVQFGIKLKDMASGALLRFGETARKTSAAVAVSSSKTNAEIAETGRKSAETSRKVKKMAETTAVGFNEVTDAARKAGKQIDEVKQKAEKATKAADKIGSRKRGAAQGGKDGKENKNREYNIAKDPSAGMDSSIRMPVCHKFFLVHFSSFISEILLLLI